ncbi:hypothetical protein ACWKSP_17090 [Micromonosporaceae bacterium Da 78-11]
MPDQHFSVHVDPVDLAKQDLAAGLSLPPVTGGSDNQAEATGLEGIGSDAAGLDAAHHGARDGRQAARQRSERARAGRAAGAAGGRSYVFRRS